MILFGRKIQKTEEKYIYFGSLLPVEEQYKSDLFRGLALSNPHDKDIVHDIRNPLPFQNEFDPRISVSGRLRACGARAGSKDI